MAVSKLWIKRCKLALTVTVLGHIILCARSCVQNHLCGRKSVHANIRFVEPSPEQNWTNHFQRWITRKSMSSCWITVVNGSSGNRILLLLSIWEECGSANKICTFNLGSTTKNTWYKSERWITLNISCWSRSYR